MAPAEVTPALAAMAQYCVTTAKKKLFQGVNITQLTTGWNFWAQLRRLAHLQGHVK